MEQRVVWSGDRNLTVIPSSRNLFPAGGCDRKWTMIDMLSPAGSRAALGQLDVLLRTRGGGAAVSDRSGRPCRRVVASPSDPRSSCPAANRCRGRKNNFPAVPRACQPTFAVAGRAHVKGPARDDVPAPSTTRKHEPAMAPPRRRPRACYRALAGAACGVDRALACLCRGKPCQWPAM
jgi:hypothetical protein